MGSVPLCGLGYDLARSYSDSFTTIMLPLC